ncbi:MAG: excinuclease ABC subunit UvrC [Candidatus Peribacteraceae bacterium]|nr:excinuclease ABC subunit UvrC [Candidatus Peribacteraceae bacterium]
MPRPEPSSPVLQKLRKRIGQAPAQPGVYRWLGKDGEILYVGKAKDLRQRLRSYVVPGAKLGPWKESLVRQVQDFDLTVVRTELEALVLETTLIKQHRPKYNVLMKDGKDYVYVRITADTYPRIDVVRRIEDDGAQYFGPKPAAWQVYEVLAILRKLHRFRTCKMSIEPVAGAPETIPLQVECTRRDRPVPCLDFHMEQCSAPCIGALTPAQYKEQCIDPVARFWKGELEPVTHLLKQRMQEAAIAKQFEAAAQYRDQLQRITSLSETQAVSDASGDDTDAVGLALRASRCQAVLYQKRGGKVTGEVALSLSGQPETLAEVLEQFLPLYYSDNVPPPLILIPEEVPSAATLQAWLTERAGRVVELRVPARGQKTQLLDLAMSNAKQKVMQQEAKWEAEARNTQSAAEELQAFLSLPEPPKRIECYDISHLGGTETVGSMVVFENGKPKKEHYRSFTIQSLKTGDVDDYRSLQEVLRRRLRHLTGGTKGETERWATQGVVIRKALKADQAEIARLRREIFDRDTEPDMYKETAVAAKGEILIGIARLSILGKGVPMLRSLAVAPEARGGKLGLALARFLLSKTKAKKVYLFCEEALQGFYAGMGFRHIIKPPESVLEIERGYRAKYPDEPLMMPMVWQADESKADASLQKKPDILLIDGGLGQLHAVEAELALAKLDIALISLAKREEEVFARGSSTPLPMASDSPAHILLRRLRDEAHRFANRHRESRATARMVASRLPDLPGIGPVTAQALLKKFGSLQGAQAATDEQLREILTAAQLKALRSA